MADLQISQLPALAEADLAAGDELAIVDDSASETKRITAKSLVEKGVALIDAGSIPGTALASLGANTVVTASITDANVTTAKIANSAITATQIADATITGAKLVNDTVTATQIAANAITASELGDNAVDEAAIASNAVTVSKIANTTVTYAKLNLSDGDIPAAKIATNSLTATQIAANAIGSSELADDAVDTAAIANLAVTAAKIAGNTITAAQIANTTITATQIANNTITATQIAANAIGASELADDAVDTDAIANLAVTNAKIANTTIAYAKLNISDGDIPGAKIANSGISSSQIATNAVTANELNDSAVDTAAIAANAVTAAKIASNTITATEIAANAIGASELADNAVDTAAIADGAVTSAKLSGALASGALADDSVITAKIADDAVTAAKLGANAVDATALADNAVDTGAIAASAVTDAKVATGISGTKLTDGTVTAAKLNTSNIDRSLNVASGNLGINNVISAGTSAGISYNAQGLITAATALVASDLPVATATAVGGVSIVSTGGLSVTGAGALSIAATTTGATATKVTFNNFGQITGTATLAASDLPKATASAVGGVSVPTGGPLSVDSNGAITVSDSGVTAGTNTKVTVDAKGRVTALAALADSDLPNHSAALITSGSIPTARIANSAITGTKLANASTTLFGSVAQTGFPTSEFTGQFFFDSVSEDLYIYDGNAYQPVTTLTKGSLVFGGTYNASTSKVASVTTAGAAAGLTVGSNVPTPSATTDGIYLVVENAGTPSAPAPVVALAPPDYILGVTNTAGSSWEEIDLSQTVAGQVASNITFTPFGQIQSTNVQDALEELETEKLAKAGGTVTGQILFGNTATLVFEGSSTDAFQTTLGVVNPTTADKTILLPNTSGTLITTNDSGTVTSAMIADATIVNGDISTSAAIAFTKLADLASAKILVGDANNDAVAVSVTGDISISNSGVVGISSGVIVDGDISGSAAITGSKIATGTTSAVGVLQLTNAADSTSTTTAATPAAVKTAKDAADAAATTANAALPKAGGTLTDNLIIDNAKSIRLSEADSNGSHYLALKAPDSVTADITFTLPDGAGSAGQRLQTDGSGNLSWGTDNATDPTKLPLAGGTMSGAIAMGTSKITGLGDPTAAQDAATKTYVDTADALKLNLSGGALTGNLTLNAQSDVRFADSDSSHYIALQSPATVTSSFTLTLPSADASVSGYVLASDGSGTLSWVDPGSSSSPTFTGDATLTNDGALVGFSNLNATYTGNAKNIIVTVASKTGAHRYNGTGSSSGYKIDGKESPFLTLTPGRTYKFDQADNSNSGHPLRFYLEADKTTAYTTGVTTNGTAGSAGAYTQIVVSDTTPQILHYQCSSHASMGNSVQTNSNIASTAKTLATARTIGGVSFDGSANINLPGVNASGTQDTSGTAAVATAITIADESSDTTCFPLFATAATGDLGAKSGSNLTFNSSSGALTATSFVGALTGNASGSAATVTGAAQSAITSLGTLAGLVVDGDVTLTGAAANVTWDKSTDDLIFNDNAKAIFGTSSDGLEVYHSGSHSLINNTGTGNLYIKNDNGGTINLQTNSSDNAVKCIEDGAVELYWNGTSTGKKLETSATGATVTGTLVADGLTVSGSVSTGDLTVLDPTPDLKLQDSNHTGNSTEHTIYFKDSTGANQMNIGSPSGEQHLRIKHDTTDLIKIQTDGKVGIGTTSPNSRFQVNNTSPVIAEFYRSDGDTNDQARIALGAYSSNPPAQRGVTLAAENNGSGHDFIVNNSSSHSLGPTEKLRVDSAGRCIVGGGTHGGGSALVVKGGNQNTYSTAGFFSNHTNPTSGTDLAQLRFGSNATGVGATIDFVADADWGTNDFPTKIVFKTCPDGSNSIATALTIDRNKHVTAASYLSDQIGDVRSIPQNATTSAYTLVALDNGKAITNTSGGVTIPNGVFGSGSAVSIINHSGSDITLTQASGLTIYNTADGSTGNRTLAARGMATVWFQANSTAYISGAGLS